MSPSKIVTSPHYHLWTDALHSRALARAAHNKWDKGTYVRWTVTISWTVLEIACQDALSEPDISRSFRRNLDASIEAQGFNRLNWSSGIWQQVRKLQETRKGYMHRFLSEINLFPSSVLADKAIQTVRAAVADIYAHVDRAVPVWIHDDEDRGWDNGKRMGVTVTLIHAGASEEDPKVIKIYLALSGEEKLTEVLPAGTDYSPYVDSLIRRVKVPISSVKVYEGLELVHETKTAMRGS